MYVNVLYIFLGVCTFCLLKGFSLGWHFPASLTCFRLTTTTEFLNVNGATPLTTIRGFSAWRSFAGVGRFGWGENLSRGWSLLDMFEYN